MDAGGAGECRHSQKSGGSCAAARLAGTICRQPRGAAPRGAAGGIFWASVFWEAKAWALCWQLGREGAPAAPLLRVAARMAPWDAAGGGSLLPMSPRSLPSWPWHWRGEAPAGRRAGWCLLTLVHSRMSGSQSRAGRTKRTQRPFSLASACSCRNSGLPRLLGGSRSCQPQLFGSCRRWVMQCSAPADTKMGITSQMPSLMPAKNASPSFSLPSGFFPAETVPDEVVVAPWWWSQGSPVPLHLGLCRREHLCLGELTAKA